jgi:hypothetical protein
MNLAVVPESPTLTEIWDPDTDDLPPEPEILMLFRDTISVFEMKPNVLRH